MRKNLRKHSDNQGYGVLEYVKKHNITGPLFALAVPRIGETFADSKIPVQRPTRAKVKRVKTKKG